MVIPSREENWGLAVNEAMASKNAIISSNAVGCAKDLIKYNHNGYIFKNDDYNDLAKKISMIFDNKKKLIKFGNNSSKIISRWSFNECYIGLNGAIKFIRKK
jgi:glycosyltransferase involved in cell wall biosynthesis